MTRLPRRWLVPAALAAGIVAVNLVVVVLARLTEDPGGPTSSSYATAPEGVAAYASLLQRNGHPIRRVREPLAEAELDPSATLVVLDPGFVSTSDAGALAAFVRDGGTLIAGGKRPDAWTDLLLEYPPSWSAKGTRRAAPVAPVPEASGVDTVEAGGTGSWADAGEALPVLAGDSATIVAVAAVGTGRMALLADTSVLQNRFLDEADNAALGVALAGERSRPVHFVESVHGYGEATGLAAIPTGWRVALAGLAFAALLLIWARGRRLGPPEAEAREFPPRRREYVEALAAVLARTKKPEEAVAPLQAAVRERLVARAGRAAGADREALRKAAVRLGLSEAEVQAVLEPVRERTALLAAGRALARVERASSPDGGVGRR